MRGQRGNPGLQGKLLDNGIDSYVLALETINRLSVRNRVAVFSYLMSNAWELMLKAKIIKDSGNRRSIYSKSKRGEPLRSISLREALNRVFPNTTSPTRRNVERIAGLRDEAVHLVINDVPPEVLSLFQAAAVNYHRRLNDWWGMSLSDRVTIGMMTIVYDFSPEQFDLSNAVLRRRLGSDAAFYLARLQKEVREEFDALGKPAEYSIGIGYTLALVQQPQHGDIVLSKGPGGATVGIVEVPKDPSKSHPYRQMEVVARLNADLNDWKINPFDVQSIVKAYGVKSRPEFYYLSSVRNSSPQYSEAFIEWIIDQYQRDPTFFTASRRKAKASP